MLRNEIPDRMQQARRWLLWRAENAGNGKPRKVPYYLDGTRRSGKLDSDSDRHRLGGFDDALTALERGGNWTGVGFALGPDGGQSWQGIDLDDTEGRPELAALIDGLPGYVERSPSGRGVHAIGCGPPVSTLGANGSGIEAYSTGRFFTVTGDAITGNIEDLSGYIADVLKPLHAERSKRRAVGQQARQSSMEVPAGLVPDLRSALAHLRADDRDLWVRMGLALKPMGDRGRGLWIEWSQGSDKYDPADAPRVWDSLAPTGIDHRAVFAEATRQGWVNPKSRVPRETQVGGAPSIEPGDDDWPEPADLSAVPEAAPYPVDAFPDPARAAIIEYQRIGQQPMSLVACSALGQIALAAQPLADVARDAHLCSPISLNLLVLAESGERKSAADKVFGRAARDWQRRARDRGQPEQRALKAKEAVWKARVEGVTREIRNLAKKDDAEAAEALEPLQARLVELERNRIVCPPLPALTYEDVNPASLQHALATGWPSAGLFSDEGGAMVGSHGMGEETATALLSLLNILWDARDYTPTRKQAAAAELRGRRFSAFLMIQPALMDKLIDKGARSIGFIARFLLCKPDSTMGSRFYQEPPASWPALEQFEAATLRLLEQALPVDSSGEDKGANMHLKPPRMELAPDAKAAWVAYHDEVEAELGQFGELAEIRDLGAKSAENAVRTAAALQVFADGAPTPELALRYMQGGIDIARWHLQEARRLFLEIATPQDQADARELVDWLLCKEPELTENDEHAGIAARSILRLGPAGVRNKERRDAALRVLEESGHVHNVQQGKQKRLYLNPKLRLQRP